MSDNQKYELERLIQNIFFSLCNGVIDTEFKRVLSPKMNIEEKFNVESGAVVTDIFIYSKKIHLVFLLEIKNVSTPDYVDENQIKKYLEISNEIIINQKGINIDKNQNIVDVSFCSESSTVSNIKAKLETLGINLPVITFNSETLKLLCDDISGIQCVKLSDLLTKGIELPYSNTNEIPECVKFSLGSKRSEIMRIIGQSLFQKKTALRESIGISVSDICKKSFAENESIWVGMDSGKKKEYESIVTSTLNQFNSNFPDKIKYDTQNKTWKANVYDDNGVYNFQKLEALRNLIQSDEIGKIDDQMELF